MTGSLSDAEDALQDSLVGAWRGLASFEGRSSLRTWLDRVTTNDECLPRSGRRATRPFAGDGPMMLMVLELEGGAVAACHSFMAASPRFDPARYGLAATLPS